jgi:molecular chaperone DnaK (HSP70)
MPLVQKRVTEFFGRQPCKGVHPDEAVAVGAAIMAHSLTDQSYHKVELLDVLPMAIGIAKVNGEMLRLFPKFSPIPSYKSLILTNSKDGQKSIMLRIYQGDQEVAAENEILGTFIFSGIREAKKGDVKVEVLFHIDSEGILTLQAKDKDTGQQVESMLKLHKAPEEGDDKKGIASVKKTSGGVAVPAAKGQPAKAAIKTTRKADEGEASAAPKKDVPPPRPASTTTTGAGKAPWEAKPAAPDATKTPATAGKDKAQWHDPVFDKATRELPKGDVQKILAQARAELEGQKSGAASASAPPPAAPVSSVPSTPKTGQTNLAGSNGATSPGSSPCSWRATAAGTTAAGSTNGGASSGSATAAGTTSITITAPAPSGIMAFFSRLFDLIFFWRKK